jgi:hypothetical protein
MKAPPFHSVADAFSLAAASLRSLLLTGQNILLVLVLIMWPF